MNFNLQGTGSSPSTAWLQGLHNLLDNPSDIRSLYWRTDHSFAIRAASEVPFDELRGLGIVRMDTLIHKLEQYGFRRVSEDRLSDEERKFFHVFVDYSGGFVPFDSRAIHLMRPVAEDRQRSQSSSTGSIVDHGEAFDQIPETQRTPIRCQAQRQVRLDSSCSRSEIRRRLEEHNRAMESTQEPGPIIDSRLPLPPIPPSALSTRYREELFDSVSTSPTSRTPALSRSTSSDCSLSPFPHSSSESSPWTPWINEFETSTFPTLTLLDGLPFRQVKSRESSHRPQPLPWSTLPNPPQFANPFESLNQPSLSHSFNQQNHVRDLSSIPPFPQYQSEPGTPVDSRRNSFSQNYQNHPLHWSHGLRLVPASTGSLSQSLPYDQQSIAGKQLQHSFGTLESTAIPNYSVNEQHALQPPFYDSTNHHLGLAVRPGGGPDRRSHVSRSQSPQKSRNLLRPFPLRTSPLHPHPYQSSSRTIHTKRDSLNHLSIRRLELLASSSAPSMSRSQSAAASTSSFDPYSHAQDQVQQWKDSSSGGTRRSTNASLDKILNPPLTLVNRDDPSGATNLSTLPTLSPATTPTESRFPPLDRPQQQNVQARSTTPTSPPPLYPPPLLSAPSLLSTVCRPVTESSREKESTKEVSRSFGTLSDLMGSRPVLLP